MSRATPEQVAAARARLAAAGVGGPLVAATLAARNRDPYIGTRVALGHITVVRSVPAKGGNYAVTALAGPMPGWQAVEALQRFANGGKL